MKRVQIELQTDLHFTKDMTKRKIEYAGHVLRGSSGLSHLQILEGRVEGKKKVGCPIRIWMKDICDFYQNCRSVCFDIHNEEEKNIYVLWIIRRLLID